MTVLRLVGGGVGGTAGGTVVLHHIPPVGQCHCWECLVCVAPSCNLWELPKVAPLSKDLLMASDWLICEYKDLNLGQH